MPSDTKTYQEETYIDNTIRLRGVLNTMPDFARDYFRAIEPTTSPRHEYRMHMTSVCSFSF